MIGYALARKGNDTEELSYALGIFDNGEMIFAKHMRIGFGEFVDAAAIAAITMVEIVKKKKWDCKIYTNSQSLVGQLNDNKIISSDIIKKLKDLNYPIFYPLTVTPEMKDTNDIFFSGYHSLLK